MAFGAAVIRTDEAILWPSDSVYRTCACRSVSVPSCDAATLFSPGWIAAIAGALIASVWLASFAFKHVEYSNELWWQLELHNEASRSLRASVGAALLLGLFALSRLIGYAPHDAAEPTDEELEAVGPIIAAQTCTIPYLVYLRDKAVLFDEEHRGFVMYGVQGRTWVALGDPVGPPERIGDLIRVFLERGDDFSGIPVFYDVRKEHLHRYADFGLTLRSKEDKREVFARRCTALKKNMPCSASCHAAKCQASWINCAECRLISIPRRCDRT